jgi:PAS domain S-box-containing protein
MKSGQFKYLVLLFFSIFLVSLFWNIFRIYEDTNHRAESKLKAIGEIIETTRQWNISKGGVYIPITPETQPNPYLKIPDRDIVTNHGLELTLINPAYMTRQISEFTLPYTKIRFHITSLKPKRPNNKPDKWEKKALLSIKKQTDYFFELINKDSSQVFRYMYPFAVKAGCLKCHGDEGFKIGDLRGGVSITYPAKEMLDERNLSFSILIFTHIIFFIIIFILLIFFKRKLDLNAKVIKESEEKYRLLFDNMINGFSLLQLIYDKDNNPYDFQFLEINNAACNILDIRPEDILGKTFHEIHAEYIITNFDLLIQTVINNTIYKQEIYLKKNNKHIEISAFSPKESQLAIIFEDITEQKNAENQIIKYTADLEELNTTKDKFFSIIAHDLKNPFQAILGFTELLVTEFKNYKAEEIEFVLNNILNSSKQAYNLLDNLLIWAGSQTGRIEFIPQYVDLEVILLENIELAKMSAARKNILINYNIYNDCKVFGDPNMIDTIVRNLLSNAIKFTQHNGKINVSIIDLDDYCQISVKDTGVGIKNEKIDQLFRIDSKISSPGTDNEKGTGLGLVLCKGFIEKNGGSLRVESELGNGSEFIFTLPKYPKK